MKRVNTVKTAEKAIEILNQWLNDQYTYENLSTNTTIQDTVVFCECGETKGLEAFFDGGNKIGKIGICDCCGDDDAMISDVLETI